MIGVKGSCEENHTWVNGVHIPWQKPWDFSRRVQAATELDVGKCDIGLGNADMSSLI
jgi:hypothetical protein